MRPIFVVILVGLLAPILASAQVPRPEVKAPPDDSKRPVISGRVLDGLGRPVPGVSVEVMDPTLPNEERLVVAQTDKDGRFSCRIDRKLKKVRIGFEKIGYVYSKESLVPSLVTDFTMPRRCDWEKFDLIPGTKGVDLDQGIRELLASGEGSDRKPRDDFVDEDSDEPRRLDRFLFEYQKSLRPAIRRLVVDPHVGKEARRWLDWLGDPTDRV